MHKIEFKTEVTPNPLDDAAKLRIKIVGEQYKIEKRLIKDPTGRALYFVKNPLTPLYIDPKAVKYDPDIELFVIKPKFKHAIPKNLISEKVLNDEKQLSTVLARVLLLHQFIENRVIVFFVEERKNVDTTMYEEFKRHHPNFEFIQISEDEYQSKKMLEEGKEAIAEATFVYHESELENKLIEQCIFATQANNPFSHNRLEILEGQNAARSIIRLNEFLTKQKINPIPVPIKTTDEGRMLATSANKIPKAGLFTFQPQPTDSAINTNLPRTETCRAQSL